MARYCLWNPPSPVTVLPCRKCFVIKPIGDFDTNARNRSGRQSYCKTCQRQFHRQWIAVGGRDDYFKDYRLRNRDRILAQYHATYVPSPMREKECVGCETIFTPVERNQQRWCSVDCRERVRRAKRPSTPKRLRRAVLVRDNWTCYLCGGAIPEWVDWPHPLAGTADHVIPWIAGGKATLDNLRAAHWSCNRRKAASLLEVA